MALDRLRIDKDDQLAHVYLKDILDNLPRRMLFCEVKRIMMNPTRCLSHQEIWEFILFALKRKSFICQMV